MTAPVLERRHSFISASSPRKFSISAEPKPISKSEDDVNISHEETKAETQPTVKKPEIKKGKQIKVVKEKLKKNKDEFVMLDFHVRNFIGSSEMMSKTSKGIKDLKEKLNNPELNEKEKLDTEKSLKNAEATLEREAKKRKDAFDELKKIESTFDEVSNFDIKHFKKDDEKQLILLSQGMNQVLKHENYSNKEDGITENIKYDLYTQDNYNRSLGGAFMAMYGPNQPFVSPPDDDSQKALKDILKHLTPTDQKNAQGWQNLQSSIDNINNKLTENKAFFRSVLIAQQDEGLSRKLNPEISKENKETLSTTIKELEAVVEAEKNNILKLKAEGNSLLPSYCQNMLSTIDKINRELNVIKEQMK